MHKELKVNNVQLKKLNDEKNQLLGIAAHDLRSPLSTIAGYIDIVEYSLPENSIEDQSEIFKTLNMMLEYMLSLISDVLDYSKIASGKLVLAKDSFNLISFLDQSVMLNNILGAKKNIKVHSLYQQKQITVEADQNKLKQVMDNLLSNAFKYSEINTNVFVDVEVQNSFVVVKVKDEGNGIPEKEISKLFKPFTTTSVKSTAGETSTGLGLVSVKKIIETHGGTIDVKSEVNKGSTFFFSLPYNPEFDHKSVTGEKDKNVKLKLLVVESEEFSDDYMNIIGFDISSEIFHATSGTEAIEICKNNPDIHLILMDVKLPDISGIETARRIREFNRSVKIFVQDDSDEEVKKQGAINAGLNEFICKPIQKTNLLEKINLYFGI